MVNLAKLPPAIRELKAIEGRQFRLDLAWPEQKLAVEVHGGVFIGGRHTRGVGFSSDCEKTRLLVLMGWRMLPFTGEDVRERPVYVLDQIREALGIVPA